MFSLLLFFQIGSHAGRKSFIQQRLVLVLGDAVIAVEFSHLLLADRDRIHLGAIRGHLAGKALLFFREAFRFAIKQL